MSQISPPIRIVLIAVIGLVAVWMLFLKPKAEPVAAPNTPAATAPGVTGLSNATDEAEQAAAQQEARDEKLQQATGDGDAAAKPGDAKDAGSAKAAAIATGRVLTLSPLPRKATKGLPFSIRRALERRDVFAIGIVNTRDKRWAPMAADDRSVRRELRKVNRYRGTVAVDIAPLGQVAKLEPVIGELDVSQTPAVVVVDSNRVATVLEGYVDRVTINQAIADARRDSTAFRIKNAYLSEVNELCAQYSLRLERFALPSSRSAIRPSFRRLSQLSSTYTGRFARLTPPARWRGLQASLMSALRDEQKLIAAAGAAYTTGGPAQALRVLGGADVAAGIALDRRFDRAGVTSCVGNRRS